MHKFPIFILSLMVLYVPLKLEGQEQWVNYANKNYINCITVRGNQVWAGTGVGLILWDVSTGNYRWFTTRDGLLNNNIIAIEIDKSGNIWTSFPVNGISKFDGKNWTSYSKSLNGVHINSTYRIAVDNKGNVWFAQTGNGVTKFDGKNWTNYKIEETKNNASLIGIDRLGDPWIYAIPNWLMRYDGKNWIKHDLINVLYKYIAMGGDRF